MSFLDVVALLSLSVFFSDFSSSHFCGSAGVEARALYRLDNCPPLALKDSCLGWPLEELGSWACATRQSSYICPFNNPVSLWCLGQLLCCGLCFVLVDEVYWFCEYISLAKRKAPLWCWVSKCCCDHLLEDVSFASISGIQLLFMSGAMLNWLCRNTDKYRWNQQGNWRANARLGSAFPYRWHEAGSAMKKAAVRISVGSNTHQNIHCFCTLCLSAVFIHGLNTINELRKTFLPTLISAPWWKSQMLWVIVWLLWNLYSIAFCLSLGPLTLLEVGALWDVFLA